MFIAVQQERQGLIVLGDSRRMGPCRELCRQALAFVYRPGTNELRHRYFLADARYL
jgi:hypothetical protein